MGDPKKIRKTYSRPMKRWDKDRIIEEGKLVETYGLRNKKEIAKARSLLSRKRSVARELLGSPNKDKEEKLMNSLRRIGILSTNANLDDILSLTIEPLLERRLQTIVFKKGLANTIEQARQLVVHRHIVVNGSIVNAPGYIVKKEEEKTIAYKKSEMKDKIMPKKKMHIEKQEEKKESLKEKFEAVKPKEEVIKNE